jgi:photosystem II stability/assembly factor-like uncharacterized protein
MKSSTLARTIPAVCALAWSAATMAQPDVRPGYAIEGNPLARSDAQGRHSPMAWFALAAPPAQRGATAADWTALGPPGGDAADVAASPTQPSVMLAGIAPGNGSPGTLYRSDDAGATWAPIPDLAQTSVYDIEFEPDGSVFLGTSDGVWTSSDDGLGWTRLDLGIGLNQQVLDVALDPADGSTLWVGVSDAFGQNAANVMKSTDGGLGWSDRTPPHPAPMSCNALVVDPADPDTVVAAFGGSFGGGEVWVSTDGGLGWTDRSGGLPANPMRAVAFDGTRVLLGGGQLFGSQYVGLYASSDLGANWDALSANDWPLLVVTGIAVDPADPDTLLVSTDGAGINRSSNGGVDWEFGVGDTGSTSAQSVRYAHDDADTVLVGANAFGVLLSADGGDAFAVSSQGISELDLYSVAASPVDPDQIAVAVQGNNSGGVFSSDDGGATWVVEPVPSTRYSKVGFAPDGTLYAISSGPSSIAPEGLYRREAGGSWTGLGPDQGSLYESDLRALAFSDVDPDLIFQGGEDFGVAGNEITVWRSADAGQSWVKQYEGAGGDFVYDLEIVGDGSDQNVIASYDGYTDPQQGGALRSTDGGINWDLSLNGLPGFARLAMLCQSPATPGTVYLSALTSFSNGGVFSTTDDAASWVQTAWNGPPISDIACDPLHAGVLYIGQSSDDAVQRSADAGATFAPYADGLDAAGHPRALAPAAYPNGHLRLLMAGNKGSWATPLDDVVFANGFD